MKARITEETLVERFASEGITVIETVQGMGDTWWSWYSKPRLLVGLSPTLLTRQRTPALLHEWFHHVRGDDGHQTAGVEARINEQVAQTLLTEQVYASAETLCGPSVAGLAQALEVPIWVVQAYQRVLQRDPATLLNV